MTNIQRWLLWAGVFAVPYFALTMHVMEAQMLGKWLLPLQLLPIILVALFGVYSATVVLYRTFTFNDCPKAAEELQQQIKMARKDLIAKGFKFRD